MDIMKLFIGYGGQRIRLAEQEQRIRKLEDLLRDLEGNPNINWVDVPSLADRLEDLLMESE